MSTIISISNFLLLYINQSITSCHLIIDIGQIRDLSTVSCGGFRVRKEELKRYYGCSWSVWTVFVNSNLRKKKREREKREEKGNNKEHSVLLINSFYSLWIHWAQNISRLLLVLKKYIQWLLLVLVVIGLGLLIKPNKY